MTLASELSDGKTYMRHINSLKNTCRASTELIVNGPRGSDN